MQSLTPEQLEALIASSQENTFLIVDVRQAEEFRLDHIPGAVNIPLARVECDPLVSDNTRKVIFYCRGNSRSKVAAVLAAEAGLEKQNIFHLTGGMMAYTGEILLDPPRVDLFSSEMTREKIMERTINFEKGAFFFYGRAMEKLKQTPLYKTMANMAQAEKTHANTIFTMLRAQDVRSFEAFFDQCAGDILEGGKPLGEINDFWDTIFSGNTIKLLEFAIDLEFCAYDLYKAMAETSTDPLVKELFFALAQAEKQHLSTLIESLDLLCPDGSIPG